MNGSVAWKQIQQISVLKVHNKIYIVSIIWAVVSLVSCTRIVSVPTSSIRGIHSYDARSWRIETTDSLVYSVVRFSTTDTTLVIESIIEKSESEDKGLRYAPLKNEDLPVEIPIQNIERVDGLYVTEELKIVTLSIIGIAAVATLLGVLKSLFAFR